MWKKAWKISGASWTMQIQQMADGMLSDRSWLPGFCRKIFIIFTNPSARAGYDTRSIFKRSLTGLNSEYSFSLTSCLTKAEEPSLSYYLPIAGGRVIGFIPFPRLLVLCEMPSVSSRKIFMHNSESTRYDRRKRSKKSDCLPFLTRRDREGSDVCRFSSATFSLKLNRSSILTF